MKKQELHSLVQECIAEVLDEKYSEFQRVDKGSKDVDAKDKGEEDVYGAGYAAGERAAKAKYKKLAEAYKALKEASQQVDEEGFGIGPKGMEVSDSINEARFEKGEDIGEPGPGFKKVAKAAEKQYGSKKAGQKVAGAILKKVLAKKK